MISAVPITPSINAEEVIETLSPANIVEARQRFQNYKNQNIITGDFDDHEWQMYNEVHKKYISFDINKKKYNSGMNKLLGMDYTDLVLYVKTFTVHMFGAFSQKYISITVNLLCNVINNYDSIKKSSCGFRTDKVLSQCIDFFEILPVNTKSKDEILSTLEEIEEKSEVIQDRLELRNFSNYFLFDKLLRLFWTEASDEEKIHYFPVYLWWKITTIIPTRVTEFTITPRDCTKDSENGPHILLRKTRGKKGRDNYKYNVTDDYKIFEFPITHDIKNNIDWYVSQTNSEVYRKPDNGTLFRHIGNNKWKHLSSGTLNYLIKQFFKNVLNKKYGVTITNGSTDARKVLDGECIEIINARETRHIAMINALLSTNNLYICKTLAWHDSISITAWYAENIERYMESSVFAECESLKHSKTDNIESVLQLYKAIGFREVATPLSNTTSCTSQNASQDNFSDCLAVAGDCEKCRYHRNEAPSAVGTSARIEIRKEMEFSVEYLKYALEEYRKGICGEEEIENVLSRIKRETSAYRFHCIKDIIETERSIANEQNV